MKSKIALLFSIFLISMYSQGSFAQRFREQQKKYPRVQNAFANKKSLLIKLFKEQNLSYPPQSIFIRIFKEDRVLELWAQARSTDTFKLVKTYKICALSGNLGPKRQQGDIQIPEGFYYINHFNPTSTFYLSLKINYPNESDNVLGVKNNLGGDIFIHGNCVTIGCIPITDSGIKELYVIAVEAKSNGQKNIPVHIFPTKLNQDGMDRLKKDFSNNKILLDFWYNLREGFDIFDKNHRLPIIQVDKKNGKYKFINDGIQ